MRTKPRKKKIVIGSFIFLIAILSISVGYARFNLHASPVVRLRQLTSTPTYKPVVGDVQDPEDDDPDITFEQQLVPGFQFQRGGYELSGKVTDAQSGRPVFAAVVWIDLPVQEGKPASVPLHTVTDATGSYQFVHIAPGVYTVVASRYNSVGDGHYYAERVFSSVALAGNRSGLVLSLAPILIPGKRLMPAGSVRQAKNVILIDLRGFYAASLLDDTLLVNSTHNLRAFLERAHVLPSVWHPYGWRPLDQYALLTGTYPQWATYDPWPQLVPWGMPDHIDTTFWFNGGRNAHLFGQESIFDVAKGYGMETGVVASTDYVLSDATTRSLDLLQRSSSFSADRWLVQMKDAVLSGAQQANGFLLYSELASLPQDAGSSSPDAPGDDYQQALLQADATFGQLLDWLWREGFLHNTLIVLATSQAQANHTDADNYYGMGATGQGTSKQTLLALSGPGACTVSVDDSIYSSFIIAPMMMHALGLPAPAESRMPSPFQEGCP